MPGPSLRALTAAALDFALSAMAEIFGSSPPDVQLRLVYAPVPAFASFTSFIPTRRRRT